MDNPARVELTLVWGWYGQKSKTVAVDISPEMAREMMEGLEISNDPFSRMLASFDAREDSVSVRERVFKMRRSYAEEIGKAMVPALLKAFGVNDKLDGYRIEDMGAEEREWHQKKGRL